MAGSAAKKTGARANSTKQRPKGSTVERMQAAQEINLLDTLPTPDAVAAQAKSPYPEGVKFFSYTPKGGGDPILLAINGFEPPTKVWLFDLSQQPILSQTWAWMRKANVPKDIQRQCQLLPDVEYFEMFDQWFDAMKAARGGGPKGAVTSGK